MYWNQFFQKCLVFMKKNFFFLDWKQKMQEINSEFSK